MAGSKAATTFHQFSSLPVEIRVKIWKAALRPISSYTGCVTYQHLFINEDSPSGSSANNMIQPPGNCSTIWDQGLAGACVESKKIILKSLQRFSRLPKRFRRLQGSGFKDPKLVQAWKDWIASQPTIKQIGWTNVSARGLTGLVMGRYHAEPLVYPSGLRSEVPDIALEFDPKWLDNFPQIIGLKAFDDGHPMVDAIMGVMLNLMQGNGTLRLWLVERSSDINLHKRVQEKQKFRIIGPRWREDVPSEEKPEVFYDFDLLYKRVEVPVDYIEYPDDRSASFFHHKLSQMLMHSGLQSATHTISTNSTTDRLPIFFTHQQLNKHLGILAPFKCQ